MHTTVKCDGHSVKWAWERTHSVSTWHQRSLFPSYGKLFLMWEIRCAYFILIENNKIQSKLKNDSTNRTAGHKGALESEWLLWGTVQLRQRSGEFSSSFQTRTGKEHTERSPYLLRLSSQQKWQFKDLQWSPVTERAQFHIHKGLFLN